MGTLLEPLGNFRNLAVKGGGVKNLFSPILLEFQVVWFIFAPYSHDIFDQIIKKTNIT